MTSLYKVIQELERTYGNDTLTLFSCSFVEYVSRTVDVDSLVKLKDSDFTEQEFQDINIKIEEARKEVESQLEMCEREITDSEYNIINIFYSSDYTFFDDKYSRYGHLIYKLLEKFSSQYTKLHDIACEMADSVCTDYFIAGDYSIDLVTLLNKATVNYSRPFVELFISCLTLELSESIPHDTVDNIISEALIEYSDIYEVQNVLEFCSDIIGVVSNISDLLIMYIFGNISDMNKDIWPYGDLLTTLNDKLKPYDININKYRKYKLMSIDKYDNAHINQMVMLSIIRRMVQKTLDEKGSGEISQYEYASSSYPYSILSLMTQGQLMRADMLALASIEEKQMLELSRDIDKFKQWLSETHFGLCSSISDMLIEKYSDNLYK